MDTGKGYFEHFDNEEELNERMEQLFELKEKARGVFRKGEILEIKGSKFKIKAIGKREMRLRLMKE